MSTERERMKRSAANRKIVAACKTWLEPLGFMSKGMSSEASFSRLQGDRYSAFFLDVRNHGLSVGIQPTGFTGFVSAEQVFSHFREDAGLAQNVPFATGLVVDYVQLTRDPYKSCVVWTYFDEEEQVLAQLHDVVMNFIYATMEPIKTPNDLIDFQVRMLDSTEMFAVGRTLDVDDALRLLTLIRLHRPSIYSDVRLRVQPALDSWGPYSEQVQRHLAYIDQPGELPPLPDRSAWAGT